MIGMEVSAPPTLEQWESMVAECPDLRNNPYLPDSRRAMAQTLFRHGFLYDARTLLSGKIVPVLGRRYFPSRVPEASIFDSTAAAMGVSVVPVHPKPETEGWLSPSVGLDRVPALAPRKRWKREHFVATVENGYCAVSPWGYAAFSQTGHYLHDFCCNDGPMIAWSGVAPDPVRISGTVAVLTHSWSHAVYHWNMETLPRLELLRLANMLDQVDAILVRQITDFHFDYTDRLGIPREKFVAIGPMANIQADRLLVCSNIEQGDWMSFPNVHEAEPWVSAKLASMVPDPEPDGIPTERIYISRAKAASRNMMNEQEVRNFLERNGFKTVLFEEMNLDQKAACMRNAAVVLSPIGAALSYIPFMRPGSKCVAMYNDDACGTAFRDICANAGVTHVHVLNPSTARYYPDQFLLQTEHHREQIVDIRKLAETMGLAGISLPYSPTFEIIRHPPLP